LQGDLSISPFVLLAHQPGHRKKGNFVLSARRPLIVAARLKRLKGPCVMYDFVSALRSGVFVPLKLLAGLLDGVIECVALVVTLDGFIRAS
jgi:hypothetical protein